MLFLSYLSLGLCLGILSFEDIQQGLIKDKWLIVLGLLGFSLYGMSHWVSLLILGGLSVGLYMTYKVLVGCEGLGWGDVKMMGVSGFWISPLDIPLFLILTGGVGIIVALIWHLVYKRSEFPLGPALAIALWICALGVLHV